MLERRRVRAQKIIRFKDEDLDDCIHRRYEDGRVEWRWRRGPNLVVWRDGQGREGADERLGQGIIKRTLADGSVRWGREQGFGRTAWAGGQMVTVNSTHLTGAAGGILGVALAGALVASVIAPPDALSAGMEEELRREAERQAQQATASSAGDAGYSDFDDDLGGDDTFG